MKKNIPVIFFLLCIILFYIYNKFNIEKLNILYVGDSSIFYTNLNSLNLEVEKYLYDNITYKNIIEKIKMNDYKIIKGKNIYLNQMISKSNVLILSANNFSYKLKCKKNSRIIKEYDDILYNEILDLYNIIKKIYNGKIYIIGNKCFNCNHSQIFEFENIYYIEYDNISDIEKIIVKTAYD